MKNITMIDLFIQLVTAAAVQRRLVDAHVATAAISAEQPVLNAFAWDEDEAEEDEEDEDDEDDDFDWDEDEDEDYEEDEGEDFE